MTEREVFERLTHSSFARPLSKEMWQAYVEPKHRVSQLEYLSVALLILLLSGLLTGGIVATASEKITSFSDILLIFSSMGWGVLIPIIFFVSMENYYQNSYDSNIFCTIGKISEEKVAEKGDTSLGCYPKVELFTTVSGSSRYCLLIFDNVFCPPKKFKVYSEKAGKTHTIDWIQSLYLNSPQRNNFSNNDVYVIFRWENNQLRGVGFISE